MEHPSLHGQVKTLIYEAMQSPVFRVYIERYRLCFAHLSYFYRTITHTTRQAPTPDLL